LQEYAGIPRRKRSEGKATWPGRKQVYRNYNENGIMSGDNVTVENAPCAGQPLLQLVMQGGKTVAGQPTLIEARENARHQLNGLPVSLRQLSNAPEYPVIISAELQALAKIVDERNIG
jgi:nicotinate phosphoribosyltransferase